MNNDELPTSRQHSISDRLQLPSSPLSPCSSCYSTQMTLNLNFIWMGVGKRTSWRPSRVHSLWFGVSRKVFLELVSVLCHFGFGSSRYVDIKEQLAIFLYMSVTGLTIWHTSEQFQRSNNTILKYFHHMLGILSTAPFYTTYINLPDAHTPLSQRIHNNPKMSPFFDCALGTLDDCHIIYAPPSYSHPPYRNWKGFISQNCLLPVTSIFNLFFVILGGKGLWQMPRP